MNTWLYLTAEGLDRAPDHWPVDFWQGSAPMQRSSLSEALANLAGCPVHLLLPMELCSWLRSERWPGRRRPTAQALAFAIEDQLASELDALHLCIGRADRERRYPVLAIERERLRDLLGMLRERGVSPLSIHVDAELLPPDQAYAAWWGGRWIIGGAVAARLALSTQALGEVQALLPGDLIRLEDEGPASGLRVRQGLMANRGLGIDLLQGEFRQVRWSWPWLGMTAALLAGFVLAWSAVQYRSQGLEDAAQSLRAQALEHFQQLYPEQTRVIDLAAQFKALQGHGEPLVPTQISRLVRLSEQVLGGGDVEVQRIEYRAGDGWRLQVSAGSFAELERLRERGAQSGQAVRLSNAGKVQSRVQALLTLEDGR